MEVDYIIIGQGLAGSALAMALINKGASVVVVDREDHNSASRVAAGLITTVAGKGMNLSWRQADYLPEAISYYRELERGSGKKFFHALESLRLFDSEKQRDKFSNKRGELRGWTGSVDESEISKWNAEHGGFLMRGGGWLDTQIYLQVVREILADRYRVASFSEQDLSTDGVKASWMDLTAKGIILCQGVKAFSEAGAFSYLKHRSAKGEILTVKIPKSDQSRVINRNGWLIPMGNERWRAGATYEWNDMAGMVTQAGRVEIEGKIRDLTDLPFQILEHHAGVRPIMRKSQPYIGRHPDYLNIYFFNGLGSKGVTTAPSVAAHYADHLVTGSSIDVDLAL